MSQRLKTSLSGPAAQLAGAQALREAARALRKLPDRQPCDRLSVVGFLYSRAGKLVADARQHLAEQWPTEERAA